mgnify:CR=1 FL=1
MLHPTMKKPESNMEALKSALYLSIIAPTDEQAAKAAELAESFAADLTLAQVAEAKSAARGFSLIFKRHNQKGT